MGKFTHPHGFRPGWPAFSPSEFIILDVKNQKIHLDITYPYFIFVITDLKHPAGNHLGDAALQGEYSFAWLQHNNRLMVLLGAVMILLLLSATLITLMYKRGKD